MLFFTSKAQVYKSHLYDFEDAKASLLGDYVPAKLSFEPDERVVAACCLKDYGGSFTLFFENGKAVRIPASSYETKTNRRKLVNAFFAGSPVVGLFRSGEGNEYLLLSNASKALLVREEQITDKTTKTSSGRLRVHAAQERARRFCPSVRQGRPAAGEGGEIPQGGAALRRHAV